MICMLKDIIEQIFKKIFLKYINRNIYEVV